MKGVAVSDMEVSDDVAPAEPVPVLAKQPSSASSTQAPEAVVADPPLSTEDAARVVVVLVRAHRTIGDADLDAAIAVLDAAFPPAEEPDAEDAQ